MNKGFSGFFKSSAFARSLFVFGAVFCATLAISCRQLASFDPVVDRGEQNNSNGGGGGGTSSGSTEFSFNLKASHGLKRKVSLDWDSFSGADYYEIYFAESSSAEFIKIGESTTSSFDDNLGAGRTGYFKVRAAKNNGACSPFSSTVVGTSLATPIISGGEVNEFDATVTWSMENARSIDGTDYYESSLIFEVVCQSKDGSEGETKVFSSVDFAGSSYSCKFENLSSSRDYEFYVKAYLEGDAQSFEQSPTVDKTTLTAYTPLAPKFTASEGDSAKGISLLITLPEMVTVMTYLKDSENSKEMQDVLYPLFFEVYRKHENAEKYSTEPSRVLYYNGKEFTNSPVEYAEDGDGKPYEAGAQAIWFDDDPNLVGGEKYDYMIRSVVDANYSKVVCPEDKQYDGKTSTPESMATTARGWKSAHPSFNVKFAADGGRKYSANKDRVVSVSFGFSAEWKDLGKAENYKFAIKQSRTPWNSESSINNLIKNGETYFFDSISEIGSRTMTFGSESGGLGKDEQGSYSYTLYIVPKSEIVEVADPEKIIGEIESNMLDSITALDRVVVTEEVELPNAELAVRDGYNSKVILEVLNYEKGVTYSVERTRLENNNPTADMKSFDLSASANGSFVKDDTTVQPNCSYSYVLKATAASGVFSLSKAQVAETLGTPSVKFHEEEYAYDSISISFDKVLGAKNYVLKLGEKGDFGGGIEYTFDAENPTSDGNAEISPEGNTYNVKIKNPEGYNDAKLAGKVVKAVVTAKSSVDSAPSAGKDVNVVGPASLETRANTSSEAQDDSISVSWSKVGGAKGYLIKRVMYSDTEREEVAENSDVLYYYDSSTNMVTLVGVDGESLGGRASVSSADGRLTLTDTYKENKYTDKEKSYIDTDDYDLAIYQEAQAKIPWGLPFRYVVLPVLDKNDFSFGDASLVADGKVKYTNFATKQTERCATYGYGLKVHAEKAVSGTLQTVRWQEPFYGNGLTPRVFRRKFADGDKGNWEAITSITIKDCTISYSPSGADRYCAWEYAVKYSKSASNEIVQSYVDWMKDKDSEHEHDETDYDYGTMTKEKLNKGYLLAMDYEARYGGNGTNKGEANYYSEDVEITSWDYDDRALGPDSVELRVLSLDLAKGWQSVGTFDPSITNFTTKGLTDTIISDVQHQIVKLKPKGISEGTSSTTNGPLKILRSAKHFYGLNLSRGEYSDFDCKNYEEYAYRQITDEELIKSTMLVVAEVITNSGILKQAYGTNGYTQAFPGFGWNHDSSSRFWWVFDKYVQNWTKFPYQNFSDIDLSIPHFVFITDVADCNSTSDCRGRIVGNANPLSPGSTLKFLCYKKTDEADFTTSSLIPLQITSSIPLDSYNNATVNFAVLTESYKYGGFAGIGQKTMNAVFSANVTRNGSYAKSFDITNTEEIKKWFPAQMNSNSYNGQNPDYDWWDNNN